MAEQSRRLDAERPAARPPVLVTASVSGAVAVLTLNDPERRNPLSPDLRDALLAALDRSMADQTVRAVLVVGAGGSFCAGGDIATMADLTRESGRVRLERSQALIRRIAGAPKPVIAAVEGVAAGAGLSLAAACDVVVAAADARFTAAFGQLGLMPDLGALWSVPARTGLGAARRLLMLGDAADGAEALRIGLADRLAAPGSALETAMETALGLAEAAPLALAAIKTVLAEHPQTLEAVLRAEAAQQAELFASGDLREGLEAFRNRRAPTFRGR